MGYTVYGYVLMDDHYHLVIQTFDKKLQEIMHQINNKYSKYFNNKYKRVGHVFQGRYKVILVQDERYILKLIIYIHKNLQLYTKHGVIVFCIEKNIESIENTRVINKKGCKYFTLPELD